MDVAPAVVRMIRRQMRSHAGIRSIPQFRALTYLERHPGTSLGELSEHLGVTAPTASALVQRLVRDGLARRADRPGERRAVAITLTPRGQLRLGRARRATRTRVAGTLGALSARELATVSDAFAILGRLFEGGRGS